MTSVREQSLQRYALVFILCVAMLAIAAIIARLHGTWGPPVVALVLGLVIGVACHELGHVLCAAIGSIPIRLIVVGVGPLLWRGRYSETWIELRLVPCAGSVAPYPVMRSSWFSRMLFVLGGSLGNVAVIGLAVGLDAAGALPQASGEILGPVVSVQVFLIIMTLIPSWLTGGGTRRPNDGMQLVQLLRRPHDYSAQARAAYATLLSDYGDGNLQPPMTPASSRVLYQVIRPDRMTDEAARRDFREALMRELDRGALARGEKLLVLDALVTDGLISGDAGARAHLDQWSLQALELGPGMATLQGSRGAALVELGRYQEGKALLAPLAATSEAGSFDAFMNQAFLALAERALGDEAAARQWASAARTTAEAFQATPRMAAVLARLETATPQT